MSSSASWAYDPPGHFGQLESSSATTKLGDCQFTVTTEVGYDLLHRPISTTTSLPEDSRLGDLSELSYTVDQVTYDAVGQVVSTRLPEIGGLPVQTVESSYNRFGHQLTLDVLDAGETVARSVITGVQFDALGRLTRRSYAGGVERVIQWDPVRGVPSSMTARRMSGATVLSLYQEDVFKRDTAGRLTGITSTGDDLSGPGDYAEAQCFAYDDFNRLDSAWTLDDVAEECATLPGSTDEDWDVGGASYRASWEYSDSGRVLERMTQEYGAATPTVHSYDYLDAYHPHAATSVDDGTTVTGYVYDDAGRMVARDADSAGTGTTGDLQLQWDVLSNLVATTTGGAEVLYAYDASGQRVAHMDATNHRATAFLGDTQATDANTLTNGQGMSATRYFTHGGATVALAQTEWTGTATTAPEWFFLFGDHQGSAQLLVNADTPAEFTRTAYTPYGTERGTPTGTLAPDPDLGTTQLGIDRGWLAQTYDGATGTTAPSATGTGLTYLNARYYDTLLARFISPDPLMDPVDPQTLDPYRYADNNPIVFIDATGLNPGCGMHDQKCWDNYANSGAYKHNPKPKPKIGAAAGAGGSKGKKATAKPEYGSATLDMRQDGVGQVNFSVWISSEWAGLPGVGVNDAAGDNRGPSTDPSVMWGRSRFALTWDVGTGNAAWRTSPSCDWPQTTLCNSPDRPEVEVDQYPAKDFSPAMHLMFGSTWRGDVEEGDFITRISFDGQDSWETDNRFSKGKPTLQQEIFVLVRKGSSEVSVWYDGDSYPSRQVSRIDGSGVAHNVYYAGESFLGASALLLSGVSGYGGTG